MNSEKIEEIEKRVNKNTYTLDDARILLTALREREKEIVRLKANLVTAEAEIMRLAKEVRYRGDCLCIQTSELQAAEDIIRDGDLGMIDRDEFPRLGRIFDMVKTKNENLQKVERLEPALKPVDRPTIVCLCGSTRFSRAFQDANLRETIAGKIVLSIGCDLRSDNEIWSANGTRESFKTLLDELHLRKIDLADEVLVLNVDSYIGDSTARELAYARKHGKIIRFLEPKVIKEAVETLLEGKEAHDEDGKTD